MDPQNIVSHRTRWQEPAGPPDGAVGLDRLATLRAEPRRGQVDRLIAIAERGLPQMHTDDCFAQTARLGASGSGAELRLEGENLRYAAIVALGAAHVDEAAQKRILHGRTAAEFARVIVGRAERSKDTGALALVAWAAAEVAQFAALDVFRRIRAIMAAAQPVSTVECSWIVSAALAARRLTDVDDLAHAAADRLMAAQSAWGLFPHMLPSAAVGWARSHVGCFADQVYPIQALARLSVAQHSDAALAAANSCASRICELQGPDGQWWWHYDTRDGRVVEGYPVYSVHQHAMGPMALLDLREAGGLDLLQEVERGLEWLDRHPEVHESLVSEKHNVIWRKVGRRDPRKAVRMVSALTTAVRPGLHVPGFKALFPPTRIDYECRPYELGWLLYAWLSGGVVRDLGDLA